MSVIRNWSRFAILAAAIACSRGGYAAPALTTIQDILYRADGSRFNGSVVITWSNFQAGDGSAIAIQGATVPVINGVLKVKLAPTTTASAGANYSVIYNSQGKFQFSETWAVPPSQVPLRVRDVRTGVGTVIGPQPEVISSIQISDVTGLTTELNSRPQKGAGFQLSRAAVVNVAGQLDGAAGNLNDCVHVDGTSGPCGSGGSGNSSFMDSETPSGLVNGINLTYSLTYSPTPPSSLALFRNGILMKQSSDYTLSGSIVTFFTASVPQAGDLILASYRYGDTSGATGAMPPSQVLCSSTGQSTSATTAISLGTCTIPASLLQPGDRVAVRFNFAHVGSGAGFNIQVVWGSSVMVARGGAAGESSLAGTVEAGAYGSGTQWSALHWGASTAVAGGAGSAPDSFSSPITINFTGQMTASGADSVSLRNFTVIRYPAQSRP